MIIENIDRLLEKHLCPGTNRDDVKYGIKTHYIYAARDAVKNGWLDIIKWTIDSNYDCGQGINKCAIEYGYLCIFEWLKENNRQFTYWDMERAIKFNRLDFVMWLANNGFRITPHLAWRAVVYGKPEMVDYVCKNRDTCNKIQIRIMQ